MLLLNSFTSELSNPRKKSALCVEIKICFSLSIKFTILLPNCNAWGGCKKASGSSSNIIGLFTADMALIIPNALLNPSPWSSANGYLDNSL